MQAWVPVIAVILIAAQPAAIAQPRPVPQPLAAGTSALRGTVTDALTMAPVSGCTVTAATEKRSSVVITKDDGGYEFSGIAEGSYSLLVRCPSHLGACMEPGDREPRLCETVRPLKDQQHAQLNFRLAPGAVARGRVVDGTGRPVAKATVRLGAPFIDRPILAAASAATNADGTFELRNLPDGAWRLEVEVPPSPDAPRQPIIYYPGVLTRDDAGRVELTAGRITTNVTITVPSILESTLTVRIPPPDVTIPSVSVSLVRPSPLMNRRLELDADGRVTVRGLTEGRYFVTATGRSAEQLWVAHERFDFLGDSDISLYLQPAGKIRGRIITGRGGLPPLGEATVGAVWIDEDVLLNPLAPEESPVAVDGTFEITGLFGRRKLQLNRFDADWRIQSVLHGRSDVTDTGVDVAPNSTAEVTIVVRKR